MNQNDQQRPTPETDTAIKAAIINEDEDHERLAAVARQLERERNEAREQLEAMREAIKEAHEAFKNVIELQPDVPPWANTEATLALAKLQPFLLP